MPYNLRNSVIRNPDGKIKFKQSDESGTEHYHLGVWLVADSEAELDAVDSVEYFLHPTFRNRIRKSANRKNDFSVTFWAWGAFSIEATIHFVDPSVPSESVTHTLSVKLPADTGKNYVQVQ